MLIFSKPKLLHLTKSLQLICANATTCANNCDESESLFCVRPHRMVAYGKNKHIKICPQLQPLVQRKTNNTSAHIDFLSSCTRRPRSPCALQCDSVRTRSHTYTNPLVFLGYISPYSRSLKLKPSKTRLASSQLTVDAAEPAPLY